jgi:pyruvate formate lyase activating enzyme
MKESIYYVKKDEDNRIQCTLCPKACVMDEGKYGFCLVRKNEGGKLYLENYAEISSIALDPIEKKPLYRFMPGNTVLSIGLYGCNMNCPFCQNHGISRTKPSVSKMSVEKLVNMAQELKKFDNIGMAYTFNEPLIGYEFILDCAKAIKEAGMKNVLVSNGMVLKKPLEVLLPYIDAANIDLKCYNKERYSNVFEGHLETVKRCI